MSAMLNGVLLANRCYSFLSVDCEYLASFRLMLVGPLDMVLVLKPFQRFTGEWVGCRFCDGCVHSHSRSWSKHLPPTVLVCSLVRSISSQSLSAASKLVVHFCNGMA